MLERKVKAKVYCCFLPFGSILHTSFDLQNILDSVEIHVNEVLGNKNFAPVKIYTVKKYMQNIFF